MVIQWFSTFFVPRPIIAIHYNPTTPPETRIRQMLYCCVPVPLLRGAFGGLAPPNNALSPPNWNMEHYKSFEFLSVFRVSSPPHRPKNPLLKTSWQRFYCVHRISTRDLYKSGSRPLWGRNPLVENHCSRVWLVPLRSIVVWWRTWHQHKTDMGLPKHGGNCLCYHRFVAFWD